MGDRPSSIGVVGLAAGALGICCALPTLLSLGLVGAVVGLSMSSWLLVILGLGAAAFGGWRWLTRRHRPDAACAASVPHSFDGGRHEHSASEDSTETHG